MKRIVFLLSIFIFTHSFSQTRSYDVKPRDAFQPMFSLGSGYYNSLGDIKGPEGNYLLGNMGINTGIRINLSQNIDLSFLFTSNAKLHEESLTESFESKLDAVGFHLDYTFNNILQGTKITPFATTGAQWMYYKTTTNNTSFSQESGMNIPLGLGIALDVSERIRFDIGMNYHLSFADIDHGTSLQNNDNFTVINFNIHYDLFTKKPSENYYDESKYTKVNFKAIDVQDSDKDGVPDIDDKCPDTPKKVKVDEFGCPYDGDNDGVPDHLDKEKNTTAGAIVNEEGKELTDEELRSMYSDYDIASIEYARFYNDSEIRRDDYKNDNEYLIAKANAFNEEYNKQNRVISESKRYVIQLGKFKDDIPEYLINRFLSFEDLISIPLEDGSFIYAVGSFDVIDDAERYMIEDLKTDVGIKAYNDLDTKIIVIDNGKASEYIYPYEEENEEKGEETVTVEIINNEANLNTDSTSINTIDTSSLYPKSTIIYRVQVGAYKRPLSYDVFQGLNVVPIITGNMTRYYVGSFTNIEDALIKRAEMIARGHKGSFIVKFEDGIRSVKAVKVKNKNVKKKKNNNKKVVNKIVNIRFYVQIGVFSDQIDNDTKSRLNNIGGINKISITPGVYKYIAGEYMSLSDAAFRLSEVANNGFSNAFIYAEKDGTRIKVKEAVQILKNQ